MPERCRLEIGHPTARADERVRNNKVDERQLLGQNSLDFIKKHFTLAEFQRKHLAPHEVINPCFPRRGGPVLRWIPEVKGSTGQPQRHSGRGIRIGLRDTEKARVVIEAAGDAADQSGEVQRDEVHFDPQLGEIILNEHRHSGTMRIVGVGYQVEADGMTG